MPEQTWLPLGPVEHGVPVYCMACGTLNHQAAGLDAEGDPVCPTCESVDVYFTDPAEGLQVTVMDAEEAPTLDELEARVRAWANTVGLPRDPDAQLEKMKDEVHELEDALDYEHDAEEIDPEEVLDELGDVFVTCCALARALDTTLGRVVPPVVEKIETRAREGGAVIDGQYVKQEDLDDEEREAGE